MFDEQHKILFSLINTLHIALKEGKGKSTISDILEGLVWYAKVHFKAEEEEMKEKKYPFLEEHEREHVELLNQALVYQGDYISGKVVLDLKFLSFLSNWLQNHIAKTDRNYGPYLGTVK